MVQKQKSRRKKGSILPRDLASGRRESKEKRSSGTLEPASETTRIDPLPPLEDGAVRARLLGFLILLIPFFWAYFPTLQELYRSWMTQPDYSHGILVAPFALVLLWFKRDSLPVVERSRLWGGLVLILASVLLRFVGARLFFSPVDAYSIILWMAGTVWLCFGWSVFCWSLPAVLFLWFMIPLPYSVSTALSLPLQRIATLISTWLLQFVGQPAIAEGNTILIHETQLEVANACSGLRVFMGIIALAAAYLMLVRMSHWKKGLLVLSVVPIALLANALRIVATGLLYQVEALNQSHETIHDVSGYLMIPLAALMFWVTLWYFSRLLPESELLDLKTSLQIDK